MHVLDSHPRVVAVLGPTNTGKTHLAMERMLAHASGVIGFPLRLLARENYDRAVAAKGKGRVALVTGEEKIVPPNARYFICTVESMPLDSMPGGRPTEFLAVDEIRCAPTRPVTSPTGCCTRGRSETMFMSGDPPLLRRLVPKPSFPSARACRRAALPAAARSSARPRSAVIVRRRRRLRHRRTGAPSRGGAAVVLARSARHAATPRSPCTRRARWIISSPPTPSAWASTWTSTMPLAALRKFDGRAMGGTGRAGPNRRPRRAAHERRHVRVTATSRRSTTDGRAHENHRFDRCGFSGATATSTSPRWRRSSMIRRRSRLVRRARPPAMALAALARDPDVAAPPRSRRRPAFWAVPGARFPQGDERGPRGLLRQLFLHLTGPEERLPVDCRRPIASSTDRRRHRNAGLASPTSAPGLRRLPAGLARRSGSLAGNAPGRWRITVGRPARTPDPALRRPAHGLAGQPDEDSRFRRRRRARRPGDRRRSRRPADGFRFAPERSSATPPTKTVAGRPWGVDGQTRVRVRR